MLSRKDNDTLQKRNLPVSQHGRQPRKKSFLNPSVTKILLRLGLCTGIGVLAGAAVWIPLIHLIPPIKSVTPWILLTTGVIGLLKGHPKLSTYAVKFFRPIDSLFQTVGDFTLTLGSKLGCFVVFPLFPLFLTLWILNIPQALLRLGLRVLFGDRSNLGALYRACLWRAYLV